MTTRQVCSTGWGSIFVKLEHTHILSFPLDASLNGIRKGPDWCLNHFQQPIQWWMNESPAFSPCHGWQANISTRIETAQYNELSMCISQAHYNPRNRQPFTHLCQARGRMCIEAGSLLHNPLVQHILSIACTHYQQHEEPFNYGDHACHPPQDTTTLLFPQGNRLKYLNWCSSALTLW